MQQLFDVADFLRDEAQPLLRRDVLGGEAADLLLGLLNALADRRPLRSEQGVSRREDRLLAGDDLRGSAILLGLLDQKRREGDRRAAVALGDLPGLAGDRVPQLSFERCIGGARLGVVEANQWLTLGDGIAILDQDLRDDAALEMLDGLAIALDRDGARCERRALQRRESRPDAETADEHTHDHGAGNERPPDARQRAFRRQFERRAGCGGPDRRGRQPSHAGRFSSLAMAAGPSARPA